MCSGNKKLCNWAFISLGRNRSKITCQKNELKDNPFRTFTRSSDLKCSETPSCLETSSL